MAESLWIAPHGRPLCLPPRREHRSRDEKNFSAQIAAGNEPKVFWNSARKMTVVTF